jgi:hypothetical protein
MAGVPFDGIGVPLNYEKQNIPRCGTNDTCGQVHSLCCTVVPCEKPIERTVMPTYRRNSYYRCHGSHFMVYHYTISHNYGENETFPGSLGHTKDASDQVHYLCYTVAS